VPSSLRGKKGIAVFISHEVTKAQRITKRIWQVTKLVPLCGKPDADYFSNLFFISLNKKKHLFLCIISACGKEIKKETKRFYYG